MDIPFPAVYPVIVLLFAPVYKEGSMKRICSALKSTSHKDYRLILLFMMLLRHLKHIKV